MAWFIDFGLLFLTFFNKTIILCNTSSLCRLSCISLSPTFRQPATNFTINLITLVGRSNVLNKPQWGWMAGPGIRQRASEACYLVSSLSSKFLFVRRVWNNSFCLFQWRSLVSSTRIQQRGYQCFALWNAHLVNTIIFALKLSTDAK